MAPVLRYHHRQHVNLGNPDKMRNFQVMGFDIMLSHSYQAYLLEVNNSPSISIDEALPADEPLGEEKLCRCMDMAEPHRHQTSLVDLEVKSAVMRETFQALLGLDTQGDADAENFMPISVSSDNLWPLLARVEELYHQAGGAVKSVLTARTNTKHTISIVCLLCLFLACCELFLSRRPLVCVTVDSARAVGCFAEIRPIE